MKEKKEILKNPLIQELLSLNLPSNDFAVFGSAPIAANGLMDFSQVTDLDLVVRGSAWEKAKSLSKVPPKETDLKFGDFLGFFKNGDDFEIQIYTGWPDGKWDVDELIDTADLISGIRFVNLENVLKWKKVKIERTHKPTDAEHIKIIENYLR